MLFRIIYLWRGERHVHTLDFTTHEEAAEALGDYGRDGWRAWIESIGDDAEAA